MDDINLAAAELLTPYITILIGLVVSLWVKDAAASIVKGLMFKYNPAFNEGDHVIIDNEEAVIVKIGYRYTVFGILKESNSYSWRYVSNTRIDFLKIERLIERKSEK